MRIMRSSRGLSFFSMEAIVSLRLRLMAASDEIAQVSVFLLADGSLERYRCLGDLARLAHFFDGHVQPLGQLLRSGLTAKLLHELAGAPCELIDDFDHVDRHSDSARLIGDGARDGLANPPGSVGRELVTAAPVELVSAFHEPEIDSKIGPPFGFWSLRQLFRRLLCAFVELSDFLNLPKRMLSLVGDSFFREFFIIEMNNFLD